MCPHNFLASYYSPWHSNKLLNCAFCTFAADAMYSAPTMTERFGL